ncbi:MAG: hypothetical protein WD448_05890, partial [Woeseia sp.]
MILKASQRGGAKQLGLHLLKTEENEHVEIHEVRGFVSDDIVGALKEAQAVSRGTKAKQFLFSVSLNPPQHESVGVDVFADACNRIEVKTGLAGQPRVIVFHEKEGRRHAHAVWSRIDVDSMTAVNLPHFKTRLREVSKELYLEQGWTMPRGFIDSQARDPRNFTLDEWQQSKRAGWHARDLKGLMQECWAASDSKAAFESALRERGITLARGDRRGHVAITPEGEVLSVARYADKKAKEVRAKLGEPDELRSVSEAKAQIAREMSGTIGRHLQEARDRHKQEMAPLDARRQETTSKHGEERQRLDAAQEARWIEETRQRSERYNKGIRGLWDRLTGQHAKTQRRNETEALDALQRDREQRQSLIDAQREDRQKLQTEIQEARNRYTQMRTELRSERETYEKMAPEREAPPPVRDHFERVARLREQPP